MKLKYYVIDSFTDTDKIFSGNPAGVCLLENNIGEKIMQNIAAENNLAETAFVLRNGEDFDLRWFTPEVEVDLCGHATLASAFVISNFLDKNRKEMRFNTKSGVLTVTKTKKDDSDLFEMDFPAWKVKPVEITQLMKDAVNAEISEAYLSRDLLLLIDSEKDVADLSPDMDLLRKISDLFDCLGIIVTAKGENFDFVSRFFAPNAGITEDPVTGSAHSELIPFWSERLNKKIMTARQLSGRGGIIYCEDCGERVKIAGNAVLYMTGGIELN